MDYGSKTIAVAIGGKIGSGKSTLSDYLVENHDFSLISFGGYVRHEAELQGLNPSREDYQELGDRLVQEPIPEEFIQRCIEYFQPKSSLHVYDGLRHLSIANGLRHIYKRCVIVFINAPDNLRYQRYKSRQRVDDPKLNFNQFLSLSEHRVEYEIDKIASIADLVIQADNTIVNLSEAILDYLDSTEFK